MPAPDCLDRALSDPFLSGLAIQDYPGFFSLSAHPASRPININTQIRLAARFVQVAAAVGLIGEDRPLLVVGAGAAGATAAMMADRLGTPVRLRETRAQPFSLQANCSTRWLHPHQYDWPQAWFAEPDFPRPGERADLPLGWKAGYANEVAGQWRTQLGRAIGAGNDFDPWFNAPAIANGLDFPTLMEVCDRDRTRGPFRFAAYLFCRGFASENVTLGPYAGYRFWGNDPFEQPSAGLGGGAVPQALISGAGDGGMQDLLRFVFGTRRPVDLVRAVAEELDREEGSRSLWRAFLTRLLRFDSEGGGPRVRGADDPCLQFLDALSVETMNRLYARLRPELAFDFSRGSLRLLCSAGVLPPGFGLNRFLVRLVERFVRDRFPGCEPLISLGVNLSDIRGGEGHACAHQAAACHGLPHTGRINGQAVAFNALVVRHGLDDESRILEQASEGPSGR